MGIVETVRAGRSVAGIVVAGAAVTGDVVVTNGVGDVETVGEIMGDSGTVVVSGRGEGGVFSKESEDVHPIDTQKQQIIRDTRRQTEP